MTAIHDGLADVIEAASEAMTDCEPHEMTKYRSLLAIRQMLKGIATHVEDHAGTFDAKCAHLETAWIANRIGNCEHVRCLDCGHAFDRPKQEADDPNPTTMVYRCTTCGHSTDTFGQCDCPPGTDREFTVTVTVSDPGDDSK